MLWSGIYHASGSHNNGRPPVVQTVCQLGFATLVKYNDWGTHASFGWMTSIIPRDLLRQSFKCILAPKPPTRKMACWSKLSVSICFKSDSNIRTSGFLPNFCRLNDSTCILTSSSIFLTKGSNMRSRASLSMDHRMG